MLLDVRFFIQHVPVILAVVVGVIVLKAVVTYGVVRLVRRSTRVGVVAGLGLAQVGEFSFVLASVAATLGLMGASDYQVFLGAAIMTMLASPFLVEAAPSIADWLLSKRAATMEFATREINAVRPLNDHVIIVGYGLNGRNLTRALRGTAIPYAVLDSNGQMVRQARLDREPIFFGDGTRGEVLERVGVRRARVIVFAIASHQDEKRGIVVARHLNPKIHVVARTRYVRDIEELYTLGANEVVPEEFETSLEIFVRVLRRFNVPESRIREQTEEARGDHYELLRERGTHFTRVDGFLSPFASTLDLKTIPIQAGTAAASATIDALGLRQATGVSVVAVLREGHVRYDIDAHTRLIPGDQAVLVGDPRAVESAAARLREPVERDANAVLSTESSPPV
jgi:CPA2 family monovalent cation:H+ antiporter-2